MNLRKLAESFNYLNEVTPDQEEELMDIMLKYIKDPDDAQEVIDNYLGREPDSGFKAFDIRALGNVSGDFEGEVKAWAKKHIGLNEAVKIDGKEVDTGTIELDGTGAYDAGRIGLDDALPDIFASEAQFVDGTELDDNQLSKLTDNYPELIHDIVTGQMEEDIDAAASAAMNSAQTDMDSTNEGTCGYSVDGKPANKPAGPDLIKMKIREIIKKELRNLKK